jgi:hypothetical protein
MRVMPIAAFLIALLPFAAADAAVHRHLKHGSSSRAPALTSESINAVAPQGTRSDPALIVKTEVLLDRSITLLRNGNASARASLCQG